MREQCETRYPADAFEPIPPEGIPAAQAALGEINEGGVPPEAFYFAAERGEKEPFSVRSASGADWAIRKFFEAEDERDRVVAILREQIEELTKKIVAENNRFSRATAWLVQQLEAYHHTVKCKETKTTKKHRLASGTLVVRKGGQEFKRDNAVLVEFLESNRPELVETEKKPRWGEYKKELTVSNGHAITPDGEIVPGVTVVQKPDTFTIEREG